MKMVDILFVNQPRWKGLPVVREVDCMNPQKDYIVQPLALIYLAAAARKQECSVEVLDANLWDYDYSYVGEQIKEKKPKVVIAGFATPTASWDMRVFEIAKKVSSAKTGLWGPIPAALRDSLFSKYKYLDFIIENEPEFTMKEIASKLKKGVNFFRVKGISYRKRKKIIFNGYREYGKMDDLPIPAYDLLPMDKYYTPYNQRRPITIMRTSRGCIARCIFCLIGGQTDEYRGYGAPWRSYSAKRALQEIEYVVKEFGTKEINFFDDEFIINKQRVTDICNGIIENNLDIIWNCNARVDSADLELFRLMKKAGCYAISFGVESINKEILQFCGKKISLEQVENAIMLAKKAGIQPALFFMIGLPGETEDSIKETISFAKRIAKKFCIRPQCTIATPYPGTKFYELAKKEGWIRGDIENFEQTTASIQYSNLTREQLEYWHKQFYKQVVLNPIRIIKRILKIRHWNEVKNIPIHAREFLVALVTKMRYIR